jgi:hypothetical protein
MNEPMNDPAPQPAPTDPSAGAPPPGVIVLVRDLMFSGRIGATARAINVPVRLLRDPAALGQVSGRRLIVDLNLAGALDAAIAWKRASAGEVVGFVSHVDAETIRLARAGGLDRVLPRSQFVNILPELLGS